MPAPAGGATVARVMICDDSATIRGAIARMLEADPGIQVVAKVSNGRMAIDELSRTKVDVLILDIEMPVLDGISAAERIAAWLPSLSAGVRRYAQSQVYRHLHATGAGPYSEPSIEAAIAKVEQALHGDRRH